MAKPDEMISLAEAFLSARRPFIELASTYPEWTEATSHGFHAARNQWHETNWKALEALRKLETGPRRALLLSLLREELRLNEEPRDVGPAESLLALEQLIHDSFSR